MRHPRPWEKTNRFERFPGLVMGAWLGVVFLGLDVAAGVGYQLTHGHSFSDWAARYRRASDHYSHDLRANVGDFVDTWGPIRYPVFTNSLGFRDREVREVPMESVQQRVLFVGDSFTEGVGVVYEKSFVGIVDSVLAEAGVEVLNAGVSYYSPLIYWLKTRYWLVDRGLDVDHVAVYLDISDVRNEASDFSRAPDGTVLRAGHVRGRPRGSGRLGWLKDALKYNTIVLASIARWNAARQYRHGESPPAVAGPSGVPQDDYYGAWAFDEAAYADYGERGVQRMVEYMDSLRVLLGERRVDMTLAVYPWPQQILTGDADARHVRVWSDWASSRGVRFVNHFPDFVVGATPAARQRVVERYFIPGDVHWNAEGHRVIAERFLRSLAEADSPDPPIPR